MNSPNRGIPYVPEGTLDPAAGLNLSINVIDALLQTAVINMTNTTPPTATDGDLYIVATPATGDWAGHENDLARFVEEGAFWQFFTAGAQVSLVLNADDLGLYKFDGSSSPGSWVLAAGIEDAPSDGTTYGRKDGAWEAVTGGSSLTVQDSDSPPSVVVNDVAVLIVADGLSLVEVSPGVARIEATGGGGGGGSANITPDTHPSSPDDADDEFESGSTIDTTGGRFSGATAWSWLNQGGASAVVDPDKGNLRLVGVTGADVIRGVVQSAPVATWKYRAKFVMQTNALDFSEGGFLLYNSVTAKAIVFGFQWVSSLQIRSVTYTNLSSALGQLNVSAVNSVLGQSLPLYFEIENDATNLILRVSTSGFDGTFVQLTSTAIATHIAAVTDIGLYVSPGGAASVPVLGCDWFRRVA